MFQSIFISIFLPWVINHNYLSRKQIPCDHWIFLQYFPGSNERDRDTKGYGNQKHEKKGDVYGIFNINYGDKYSGGNYDYNNRKKQRNC